MVESRWFRRAGPGIAALGAVAIVVATTLGASLRAWQPDPCSGPPRAGSPSTGTWYRLDPVIEAGALVGQRLAVGAPGSDQARSLARGSEAFAAGPFGGTVLVGTDDGRRSALSLVDVGAGCAWAVGTSTDIVRRATLAPDGITLFEHRVERTTRSDLGVWRRSLDGRERSVRVLEPIAGDARFGRTWLTDLMWSDDGATLAVESCGEIACRFRVLSLGGGPVQTIADDRLGDIVGLTAERIVAHGACRGLPCPIIAVDLVGGAAVTLHPAAGQAVLARGVDGRSSVVHEVDAAGDKLRQVDLRGRELGSVATEPEGRRLVPGPARAGGAVEHDAGWLLFGPDGRSSLGGATDWILRRVSDGSAVQLDEVSR